MPYWTDDVKSAAKLQIIEPLTEKSGGRGWVVLALTTKMADISLVSLGELLAKRIARTLTVRRQLTCDQMSFFLEDNAEGDICYLENIYVAEQLFSS